MPMSKYSSSPKLGAKLGAKWRNAFLVTCGAADRRTMQVVTIAVEKALHSMVAISRDGERPLSLLEEVTLSLIATDLALFGESAGNGVFIFDPRDVKYIHGQTIYNGTPVPGAWRVECSSLTYAVAWGDDYVEKAFLTIRPAIAEAALESMGLKVTWGSPPALVFS